MSQYLTDENGEGNQVASNLGWSEFCEWAETTPAHDYPWLHHLINFGFANEAADLAEEIDDAVDDHPPDSADVESVAEAMAEALSGMEDAEIVIVSNGVEVAEDE